MRRRIGHNDAMASHNPALNDKIFQREMTSSGTGAFTPGWGSPADELPPGVFASESGTAAGTGLGGPVQTPGTETMRMGGTMSATAILLGIVLVAAWFGWQAVDVQVLGLRPDGTEIVEFSMPPWLFVSWIGGFVLAIVTVFKPKIARITGPLYAAAMGLLMGAISAAFEIQYDGIVLQAIGLTLAVFAIMLVLYGTRTIRVTNRLRTAVVVATMAIMLVYLVSIIASFFGSGVPMIHDAGPIGILFSLVVVGIASFNLLLDFDFIERGVAAGAPRYMEWYGAFGLMVTLIWLYLEILRLLAKLKER
jgi:uncharacterized YccA/Bax inhibitor family protein